MMNPHCETETLRVEDEGRGGGGVRRQSTLGKLCELWRRMEGLGI